MLIIPAIDIMDGKVVRLQKGDFQKVSVYDLSCLQYAKKWEGEGAQFLHVVDLDGAKTGEPKNFDVVKDIVKHVHIPVEVGGGLRTPEVVRRYLEAGVERVVLSTKVIEDTSFLLKREMKDYLERVAVSIDIKQMETTEVVTSATDGWLQSGDMLIDIPSFIQTISSVGIRYVNFSDIAKDGTMAGPEPSKILNFVEVAKSSVANPLYLTYAGGISSLEDLKMLHSLGLKGVDAVIVGRALYENKFSLKEAIDTVKQ